MNNIEITILVLIAIGSISLIGAILWTKVIKKNTWIYANKELWNIKEINTIIKRDLINSTNIANINDLFLSFNDEKTSHKAFYFLNNVVITNQNIFFISYELNKKAIKLDFVKNNEIKLYDKKNNEYDLPIEIATAISNYKYTKRYLDFDYVLIIPCENTNFNLTIHNQNQNIVFVNTKQICDFIKNFKNNNELNIDIESYRKKVAKINFQKRIKLPFINPKIKNTAWENK